MLAVQRHRLILREIVKNESASISHLAQILLVSEMTVRRDLASLALQGRVEKVHGGAKAIGGNAGPIELPFKSNSLRERIAKDAIARRAAMEIKPGASIALMGGSSVYAVAKLALLVPDIKVITNSLPVSNLFNAEGRRDQTIVLAGGIRTPTDSFVGEITTNAFRSLNLDVVFMGTHGMGLRAGFSTPNLNESETNRSVIKKASKLVIVADHTKWGEVGFVSFAELREANLLVTDTALADEAVDALRSSVQELALADPGSSREIENSNGGTNW
jgi:DeoR/GlpR family transcriptional regulator of sugar metabolism